MCESGQTSTRQPLDFSFVSRSMKRYSTKSSSFERTTRLVEHYTACEHVISMETCVELWVILTHNSLFRHTCRVVVYSVYSTFEHLTQQRYTMSIIQSRVLYSAFEQALTGVAGRIKGWPRKDHYSERGDNIVRHWAAAHNILLLAINPRPTVKPTVKQYSGTRANDKSSNRSANLAGLLSSKCRVGWRKIINMHNGWVSVE